MTNEQRSNIPPSKRDRDEDSNTMLLFTIVAILVILVIGYFIYSQVNYNNSGTVTASQTGNEPAATNQTASDQQAGVGGTSSFKSSSTLPDTGNVSRDMDQPMAEASPSAGGNNPASANPSAETPPLEANGNNPDNAPGIPNPDNAPAAAQ